jgi:hypothetical protein
MLLLYSLVPLAIRSLGIQGLLIYFIPLDGEVCQGEEPRQGFREKFL